MTIFLDFASRPAIMFPSTNPKKEVGNFMATLTNSNAIPTVIGTKVLCDPSNKEYYFFVKFSNYMNLTDLSLGFATKGSCMNYLARKNHYSGLTLNDFSQSEWANISTEEVWNEANEEGSYCSSSEDLFSE